MECTKYHKMTFFFTHGTPYRAGADLIGIVRGGFFVAIAAQTSRGGVAFLLSMFTDNGEDLSCVQCC